MSGKNLMGRTLNAAEADAYLGGDTMALFRNQLLICAVNKLGGKVTIPVSDVDGTGAWMMSMSIDQVAKTFTLETRKKQ